MALNSTYARQQMDLYNFKLGIIGNAVNISGIDGGSDINRFTYTFNAIIHFQKTKPIDYYNQFPTSVDTESGRVGFVGWAYLPNNSKYSKYSFDNQMQNWLVV